MAKKYTKEQIMNMIVEEAKRQGVDPKLALALAKQESGYNTNAKSKVGAMGVMQLMPNTAKGLGVKDPYDPQQNIRGGIKLLAGLTRKYGSDTKRILAAYNAGSGAVDDYMNGTNKTGQNPKLRKNAMPYDGTGYKETKGYVNNILAMMDKMNKSLKGVSRTEDIINAFKKSYTQQSSKSQTVNPNNTVTGEAAGLPEQPMTGYEALQNAITIPDVGITTPTISPYSGMATNIQAQDLINALPSQFDQDYRNMVSGFITPQQFIALHAKELEEMGIKPEDLPEVSRFTPQALAEVDRIANDIKITPEQIQQVQENYNKEIANQRDFATQQSQGMVDRLNQLQQQYDQIINSDPRLQTGQGFNVDPRRIRNANIGAAIMSGTPLSGNDLLNMAQQEYNIQRSNELGIPYDQYVAAKQQAIQNQLNALGQYEKIQGNINTNQAGMVNELSKVVQKANELGIGALTENEKQLVEMYKPILQEMTKGEYDMQKTIAGQPMQIANANLNTRGNIFQIDTDALTSLANNVNTTNATREGSRLNFYNQYFKNLIDQQNAPFKNAYEAANAAAAFGQAGYDPSGAMSIFGLNMPTTNIPTQQPKQGLNWGG